MELQLELKQQGVAFTIREESEFFTQGHVQDVLACLRAALDFDDEGAWRRLLRFIPFDDLTTDMAVSLISQEKLSKVYGLLSPRSQQAWSELERTILDLRSLSNSLSGMIRHALEGPFSHYLRSSFGDYPECMADLKSLAAYAQDVTDAKDFLSLIPLKSHSEAPDHELSDKREACLLSTINGVVGYEFTVVFVIGLAEGEFPDRISRREGEPEERRIFYVAVTRARDELYLLCPERAKTLLSRFVKELSRRTYDMHIAK